MFRLILLLLVSILFLIITLPVLIVIACIGHFRPDIRDHIAAKFIRFIFRVHMLCAGTRVTVIGKERIPTDRAVLYVGNHRSIFDIIITYPHVVGNSGFIAKKSLKKIPIFAIWMKYIGCLFVDRESPKDGMRMIRDSVARIERGDSVFIFPEGTRSKQAEDLPLLPFHEGSLRIATHTSCPIVPVAINNSANILEAHFPHVKRQHVIIEFCEPIETVGMDRTAKKQLGTQLNALISERIQKNQASL